MSIDYPTHAAQAEASWEQNDLPKALQEPTQPKNLLFLILYGVGNMVMGVGNMAVATLLLPMQVASLTQSNQAGIFSLILRIGAVAAVLTDPLGCSVIGQHHGLAGVDHGSSLVVGSLSWPFCCKQLLHHFLRSLSDGSWCR